MDTVSDEDQARADLYSLIAALLLRAPDVDLLNALAAAPPLQAIDCHDGHQIGPLQDAWRALVRAAAHTNTATAAAEFTALFVSVGTPAVNPYGSHYLAGFLMEKPLAALRDDLRTLGLGRAGTQRELEDHLGVLCEVMRVLIAGAVFLAGRSLQTQRGFFLEHLAPWYGRCLDDIRKIEGTHFYRAVADFTQAFLEVEFQAFEIDGHFSDTDHAFVQ